MAVKQHASQCHDCREDWSAATDVHTFSVEIIAYVGGNQAATAQFYDEAGYNTIPLNIVFAQHTKRIPAVQTWPGTSPLSGAGRTCLAKNVGLCTFLIDNLYMPRPAMSCAAPT